MSLYVVWINRIKEGASATWLTDSQQHVYDQILQSWLSQPFVNLHGPAGSGKSFVARLLAKEQGYAYCHDLNEAPLGVGLAVLDDADYSRLLRPIARERDLGRVVLVTRQPVREAMPKVELKLDTRDVRQFCATLSARCGISLTHTTPQGHDLGDILRKEAIARGEAHVHQRP